MANCVVVDVVESEKEGREEEGKVRLEGKTHYLYPPQNF